MRALPHFTARLLRKAGYISWLKSKMDVYMGRSHKYSLCSTSSS
ncbi:hypothetical protein HMPREF0091_10385 [Fannyhessea vaginae DSM 15829]|uniref:Uncharacterized protein n=1 Tax=Fannyhessea vaginae DSM 15829 TaxID=525256 RepID=F1T3Z4_9ACTN|nr:hypothetical protein HMPREF0091_10385 [Fannyhessea vaginae DSM 15829]